MPRNAYASVFGRNRLYDPARSLSASMGPADIWSYRQAGSMTFETVKIWVRHRPPYWYNAPCSCSAVTSQDQTRGQHALGRWHLSLDHISRSFGICVNVRNTGTRTNRWTREPIGFHTMEVWLIAEITGNDKAEIPTLTELITVLSTEKDCRAAFVSFGKESTHVNIDSDEVLVSVFRWESASQQGVVASLRPVSICISYYFFLAGHHGGRHMYNIMWKELYWPHKISYVYATVLDSCFCVQNRIYGKDNGSSNVSFPKTQWSVLVWTYWDTNRKPNETITSWPWRWNATLKWPWRYQFQKMETQELALSSSTC